MPIGIIEGPLDITNAMFGFIQRWVGPIEADNLSEEELDQFRKEIRAIGQDAWNAGGVDMMMQLHQMVPDVNYFPRVVEINWNGIGTENDVNEGWNA